MESFDFESIVVILFLIISFLSSLLKGKKTDKTSKKPAPQKVPAGYEPDEDQGSLVDILSDVDSWFKNDTQVKKTKPIEVKKAQQKFSPLSKVQSNLEEEKLQLGRQISHINRKADYFRTKLKDQSTIRDYIIVSEIIGKPKALRND